MTLLKWTPEVFKRQLLKELMNNAELAGKFVEEDARRRILSIRDPVWGAGHRSYVARLLTNEVEQERQAVVIKVGLPPGKKNKSGEVTRHLGFYIEFGSKTAAAHPFLRPSVFQNGAKIVALLSGK